MIRTQIQLTEQQAQALRSLAARRGVSVARLIRESVDQLLASAPGHDATAQRARALALVGCGASGRDDLSGRHDDHLAESLSE